MNPLIFIVGILLLVQLPQHSSTAAPNDFFPQMEQDSSKPSKGTVKVSELTLPKKNQKNNKTNSSTRKNQSEKIADVTKTKAYKAAQKKKEKETKKNKPVKEEEVVENNPKPIKKNGKGLTAEEELKILAKTDDINASNKAHPSTQYNCKFAFDVIDEFTGVQKKGLFARPFFNYTPDEYRKFIKEGDFIRCEGFLSQSSGGNMALNINLYIASRDAKHKFGAIKSNSALILHPMKGKEIYLMTYQGAAPQVTDNVTVYQCSFAIDKADIKTLKKTEVDQVKISFQKGFQTYDVFYLDFLIDQFPCFD